MYEMIWMSPTPTRANLATLCVYLINYNGHFGPLRSPNNQKPLASEDAFSPAAILIGVTWYWQHKHEWTCNISYIGFTGGILTTYMYIDDI